MSDTTSTQSAAAQVDDLNVDIDTLLGTGVGSDAGQSGSAGSEDDPSKSKTSGEGTQEPAPGNKDDKGESGDGKPKGATSDDSSTGEVKTKVQSMFKSFADESKLADDAKVTRTRVLAQYEGASFNDKGDILDAEGKVIKTFEDVYKDITSDEPEVKLDKDGNQVDDAGKVIKTKAELDAEKSIVNKLHQNSSYQVKDEQGNLKVYSDDDKGLEEYTNDIAELKAKERQQAFFSQNVELAEVAKHLLAGGKLEDFNQEVDYSKVKAENLTEDQKLGYIRQSLKIKGFNDERIEGYITRVKDGSQVNEELKFALEDLNQHNETIKTQRQQAYDAEVARIAKEREDYFNSVEDAVKKGQLRGIDIPPAERAAFFDYLAKPVKDGLSQASIDRGKEDIPTMLTFEYLRYKGYNLDALIKSKVGAVKAADLRKLIAQSAKIKEDDFKGGAQSQGGDPTGKDLTLDSLLGG